MALADESNQQDPGILLSWARDEFSEFYSIASSNDCALFDALVLSRVAYATSVATPRKGLAADARRVLERHTNAREQEFVRFRDAVRESEPFHALADAERNKIEDILLDPPSPVT
jgi:hypothetical protein